MAGLKPLGYQIINLGSDTPIVLMNAVELIERLVGKKAILHFQPRHVADVPASWADINKAERLLGWRPHYPFEKGVEALVKWYQSNREWAKEIR